MKKQIIIGLSCLAFSAAGLAACGTNMSVGTFDTTQSTTTAQNIMATDTMVSDENIEKESNLILFDYEKSGDEYLYSILNNQAKVSLKTDINKYIEKRTITDKKGKNEYLYLDIFTMAKDLGWEPTSVNWLQEEKSSRTYAYTYDDGEIVSISQDTNYSDSAPSGQGPSRGFYIIYNGFFGDPGTDPTVEITIKNADNSIYRTNWGYSVSADYAVLLTYSFENIHNYQNQDPLYDLLKEYNFFDEIYNAGKLSNGETRYEYDFDKILE